MIITLTDRQARFIIEACEWAINEDFNKYDSINASYERIINKLERELKHGGQELEGELEQELEGELEGEA